MQVSFTGHRPHKLGGEYNYKGPYTEYILKRVEEELVKLKPALVISGMAIGTDQIAALQAIIMQIPVLAAIPFEGQEKISSCF